MGPGEMENGDGESINLIEKMLEIEVGDRPTIDEVLNHDFFRDLEVSDIESCLKNNDDFREIIIDKMMKNERDLLIEKRIVSLQDDKDRLEKNIEDEDLFFNTFCYTNHKLIDRYKYNC